ncbi:MAG: M23 family metallopeptidase [Clostridia bacterium]|nr:M23 family metallopeptidase [Clostridia bacterium]
MMKKTHIIYSVISICAVIAYTGFIVKNSISPVDTVEETLPYEKEEDFNLPEPVTEPPVAESDVIRDDIPVYIIEDAAEDETTLPEPRGFSPIFPTNGTVTKSFSLKHTYNKATGDWRAHSGIDISSAPAEAVLAVEDGMVTACFSDPLWGNVIEISHGEYTSIYKNLSTLIMVKEGDSVTRGEKISGVGTTSASEAGEAHLHFEMKHYSDFIDPLTLLG